LFLQIDVATIRPDCGAGRDAAGTAAYNVDQSSNLIIAKAQQKANNFVGRIQSAYAVNTGSSSESDK
jgi:hypothetical protein